GKRSGGGLASGHQNRPVVVDVRSAGAGDEQVAKRVEVTVTVVRIEQGLGVEVRRRCVWPQDCAGVLLAAVDPVRVGGDSPYIRKLDRQREEKLRAATAAAMGGAERHRALA